MAKPPDVLLLWPNLVCYVRALLGAASLGLAWAEASPVVVAVIYVIAMSLDFLDGYLARRLNETSAYGAALDVLVDVAQRGGMWILSLGLFGLPVVYLEMVCFACNHASQGQAWKESFGDAPWLVAAIMANGFKSFWGALTVAGLHFLPLYLWLAPRTGSCIGLFLVLFLGRFLGIVAELWMIKRHVGRLLCQDAVSLTERREVKQS
ncbi:unnamed protein product [Effrenium voratum]|nr:unnamed protein product [Effrenium voratum]CAJ1431212.1 unnamed protein product [Effrenium voratum]